MEENRPIYNGVEYSGWYFVWFLQEIEKQLGQEHAIAIQLHPSFNSYFKDWMDLKKQELELFLDVDVS